MEWSRGYFCAMVGAVNEELIKQYIELLAKLNFLTRGEIFLFYHLCISNFFYEVWKIKDRILSYGLKNIFNSTRDLLFYNLERPNFSKSRKTPWFIAQVDHPNTDLATTVQFTSVLDLDQLFSMTSPGGQPLPVLPVDFLDDYVNLSY